MNVRILVIALLLIALLDSVCISTSAESLHQFRVQNLSTSQNPYAHTTEPTQSRANRTVSDKWALVIGVSKFQDHALNLNYAAKDATDFYAYLVNQAHFAQNHVKLLVDEQATRENILNLLGDKWLPHVAMPDDLVLIYISTHGSPSSVDVEGLNYLVAYDTRKDSLFSTGIPIRNFANLIRERVHSNRVVIILDACHSGAAQAGNQANNKGLHRQGNFNAEDIELGTGQLVICSSEPGQSSWESKQYRNGVFTRQLIEALRSHGERTTLGEAFQLMQDSVAEEVLRDRGELQRTVLRSAWAGNDLVLSVVPAKPRRGLPEALELPPRQTIASNSSSSETSKTDDKTANPYGDIAPVWNVKESGLGKVFNSVWRFDKTKGEFDDLVDNGTQATIKIVKYDGKNIVLVRHNYAGSHKGNVYRYEGTLENNRAFGKATLIKYFGVVTFRWEASW